MSQLIQLPEPKKVNISLTSFFPNQLVNVTYGAFGQPQQWPFPEAVEHNREREVQAAPQPTALLRRMAQAPTASFSAPSAPLALVQAAARRLAPERLAYQNSPVDVPAPPRPQAQTVIETPEVDAPSQTVSHLIAHVRYVVFSGTALTLLGLGKFRTARILLPTLPVDLSSFLLTTLHIMYWLLPFLFKRSSCAS